MNIHFTNKDLFDRLLESTIFSTEIGSKMYGTSDEESDIDILNIYKTSDIELNSILNSHHQLQYKKDGVDYIFTSLHSFLRNILNGDSTINFEVINHKKIVYSDLCFLYEKRKFFYTYKIMRSYLGFGRRDLKQINLGKGNREKNKKLFHAYRCYKSCLDIYNGNFESVMNDSKSIKIKKDIFNIKNYKDRDYYKELFMNNISELRTKVNNDYNNGKLINFMKVSNISYIDSMIEYIMSKNTFNKMKFNRNEMDIFYDAEENGIKY